MYKIKTQGLCSLKIWGALGLCLSLWACSTQDQVRVSQAAITPLSDLNLVKKDIPAPLVEARQNAYASPAAQCAAIWTEIEQLNAVLGADLDQPANDEHPSLLERGVDAVKGSAIRAIGRTTEGVVPFRSWVRKLTGAEKHDREVLASVTAGAVRRGFLKGIWLARDCR